MKHFRHIILLLLAVCPIAACMDSDDNGGGGEYHAPEHGLFVVCEGNFQYGNASLSYYSPESRTVSNGVFAAANAMKLGDQAQSMTVRDTVGWVAVGGSHVVFAISTRTFREVGRVTGLATPRYIHFVSGDKAYVSQLYDNRIAIVDPHTFRVTGHITIPGMETQTGSTEQMVQQGRYVYCNLWSYQRRVVRIDTETDRVTGEVEVGIQPQSMALDSRGRLWVLTDGGYEGSPYGYEEPALYRIDTATMQVERQWAFRKGDSPSSLVADASGGRLYWLMGGVWSMGADDESLPSEPLIGSRGGYFYGLTVSPHDGDIYVADALDFQQPGLIYRLSPAGDERDRFYTGVIPGAFCWQ